MSGAGTAVEANLKQPSAGALSPAVEGGLNGSPITYREPPAAELGDGKPDWSRPGQIQWINIKYIVPDPNNPRTSVNRGEMNRLIEDIKENGYRQPLRIRQGATELECIPFGGHRRLYAAQQLNRTHLPCIIYTGDFSDDQILMELLLDNEHREALPPVDKAKAFKRLMDRSSWSATQLARKMHLDPQMVANHLTLLELPAAIQPHVNAGRINYSTALFLVRVEPSKIEETAVKLIAGQLSYNDIAEMVTGKKAKAKMGQSPSQLKDRLGAAVSFKTDRVFHVRGGIAITVKAFQQLSDAQITEALEEAKNNLSQDI